VPAAVIALAAAATLFVTRLLDRRDRQEIDWSSLLLIAGGLAVGRLLQHGGLVDALVAAADLAGAPPFVATFVLVLVAAVLSALMSNTATAALLVPLAATLVPGPATAVLVAVGCSLGMPFVVSTPPNAMAYGTGAVSSRDLLVVGMPVLVGGAALVAWTGPRVLGWFGL
jgi:solute carrier family 13 (sodium-dependent dicarboxylate transporter), member 2/3/5